MRTLKLPKSSLASALLSQNCRTIVVCGGSQNAPLLKELQGHKDFNFFHSFDERSAAFFALGKAAQLKQIVAVLVTSGTAVAECVPALVEARLRGIPLLLLSADKEEEFFDTGFPQTCEHTAITAGTVNSPLEVSLVENAQATEEDTSKPILTPNQPNHWNIRMPDPVADSQLSKDPKSRKSLKEFLRDQTQLLTLVSEIPIADHQQALLASLKNCQHPFYCESLSGIQAEVAEHPFHIEDLDSYLSTVPKNFGILKIGTAPLSSHWRNLIRKRKSQDIEVFSVSPNHHHHLPDYRLTGQTSMEDFLKPPNQDLWKAFESEKMTTTSPSGDTKEAFLIQELHDKIPEASTLYLSNSLAIRLWEKWNPDRKKKFEYRANRGCNGIDGQVSSFLAQLDSTHENWMLVGDLTLLYDSNGLDFLKDTSEASVRIVLLDNGGGQIFRKLPYFDTYFPSEEHAKRMINPQSRDWAKWAEFWGLDYFDSLKSFEHSSKHALIHCKLSP